METDGNEKILLFKYDQDGYDLGWCKIKIIN